MCGPGPVCIAGPGCGMYGELARLERKGCDEREYENTIVVQTENFPKNGREARATCLCRNTDWRASIPNVVVFRRRTLFCFLAAESRDN